MYVFLMFHLLSSLVARLGLPEHKVVYIIRDPSLVLQPSCWPEKTKVPEPQQLCGNNSKSDLAGLFFFFIESSFFYAEQMLLLHLLQITFFLPPKIVQTEHLQLVSTLCKKHYAYVYSFLANTAKLWVNFSPFPSVCENLCAISLNFNLFFFYSAFLPIRWLQWGAL